MSLRGLRARLARIEARVEKGDAPTWDEYWAAARRERARCLSSAYERLARIGGGLTTPHPGRDRDLLLDDTPEQTESDRRVVEAWEGAHGAPDIKGAADEARAKLLATR